MRKFYRSPTIFFTGKNIKKEATHDENITIIAQGEIA